MVVIQVQMWPRGDRSRAYSLGTLTLALDPATKPTDTRRSYSWRITKKNEKGTWKSGHIGDHNPARRGVWDLVYRILRDAVGNRNP